jgi:APA family basic amino acid/polyamine antiporter
VSNPRVLVALRDVEHVDGLMRLACELSKGVNADLIAMNVVEVSPTLPLDAESDILEQPGKEVLERAKEIASKSASKQLTTRLVRAREAGRAIVGEAADQGVELLIMGYHRKHRLPEILPGSTVQYVAHHAPCWVIVQIMPSSQPKPSPPAIPVPGVRFPLQH